MSMKTTLHMDDALLEKATKLTGIQEKISLVRLGLEALMSKEAATRPAQLGGSKRQLRVPPRRQSIRKP